MAQKSMFQEGRMGKLQKDLQEISDDTNHLRTKMSGFLAQMDGELYSRVSGQAQLAQSQINHLADDSEQLSNFIRLAITKIQGAELQNVADAIALMKGSARVESWGSPPQENGLPMIQRDRWSQWGSFSNQLLKDSPKWYTTTPIPPFLFGTFRGLTLQLERTTLIDRMLKYKGDAEIAALLEMMQHGSIQAQMEAGQKLDKISDTLIEVGRSQAAYEIYRQFGQTSYMEVAHAEAEKARALLSELGVSKTFYDANVKLTSEYTGTPLSACQYNPLKQDYSIMPTDDQLLTMIRLSMGDREYRAWAMENYDAIAIEIAIAKVDWTAVVEGMGNSNWESQPAKKDFIDKYLVDPLIEFVTGEKPGIKTQGQQVLEAQLITMQMEMQMELTELSADFQAAMRGAASADRIAELTSIGTPEINNGNNKFGKVGQVQKMQSSVGGTVNSDTFADLMSPADTKRYNQFWDYAENGLSVEDRVRISDWSYPPDGKLYNKYQSVYTEPKYYDQKTGNINWPGENGDPNINGFLLGISEDMTLKKGMLIDRYGSPVGNFFSPEGIPYEQRALAPHSDYADYYVYKIVQDFEVEGGIIAPWFDRPGGGLQYIKYKPDGDKYSLEELVDLGYLIKVPVKK
ncbi:DUF4237 domain-containing protein [Paenibacillus anaericanus]|uniref:DUF4237 domain-containing protein n=1 Tax=Paenibacillus anaericanus TaxID=170367 RepID=A0A3S1BPW0_9BACL|nr:TNT domain-containing protein [Paenibacillus anaericanus]RUT46774.1 DUF4237 domain-containing protein [Paenibacillus anaericanus]